MPAIDLTALISKDPKVKYGYARNLLTFSRENPAEVYPDFDVLVKLLGNENKIIKWTAIDIIGHLAQVDKTGKIDKLMGEFFMLLDSGNLITAAHTITTLANIALAKPEHRQRITEELLKVEHYSYETDECRNIAIGKVILALSSYFDQLQERESCIEFARRQTNNTRNATGKKAEQFLKKFRRH